MPRSKRRINADKIASFHIFLYCREMKTTQDNLFWLRLEKDEENIFLRGLSGYIPLFCDYSQIWMNRNPTPECVHWAVCEYNVRLISIVSHYCDNFEIGLIRWIKGSEIRQIKSKPLEGRWKSLKRKENG